MGKYTIRGVGGTIHPDPDYFGFDWPEVSKLLAEHEDLSGQHREINRRLQELEATLEAERKALPDKRAQALRSGKGAVSTKHIEKIEQQIRDAHDKAEDIKRAAAHVERDLQAVLVERRGGFLADIAQRRRDAQVRAERLRAELEVPEWEMDAMTRLENYLTRERVRGGLGFMGLPRPRPEVPTNVGGDG